MKKTFFIIMAFIAISSSALAEKSVPPFKVFRSGAETRTEACETIRTDIEDYLNYYTCESGSCSSIKNTCGCNQCVNASDRLELEGIISSFHELCQSFVKCKCAPAKC